MTYIIIEENGKQVKKDINEEKVLKKPVNHIVIVGTKVTHLGDLVILLGQQMGAISRSQLGQRWGVCTKELISQDRVIVRLKQQIMEELYLQAGMAVME